MKAYHFAKNLKKGFFNFFEDVKNLNGVLCFDFEDSIAVNENEDIVQKKNAYREKVLEYVDNYLPSRALHNLGFRINGINSVVYKSDVESLNRKEYIHAFLYRKLSGLLN